MSDKNQTQTQAQPEKPADPYQKYKDFKWQNPEQFKLCPLYCCCCLWILERTTVKIILFL